MSGRNILSRVQTANLADRVATKSKPVLCCDSDATVSLRLLCQTDGNDAIVKPKKPEDAMDNISEPEVDLSKAVRRFRGFRKSRSKIPCSFKCRSTRKPLTPDEVRYMFQVAAKGDVVQFQRLYDADERRLNVKDRKGMTSSHKAAENGRINILEFIFNHNGDFDVKDNAGNTPLHLAVGAEQTDGIDFLLNHGADSSILNDEQSAPIHHAVELGSTKSLQALLKHDCVDPNIPGEKGGRALHYCAFKDRAECAKILLENGAKPCIKCDNGFFPISIAGKCASANTLEVLIKHVEKLGYKREQVLSFTDRQNNMPLHCAVNSGDMKAVCVCLKAGAPVDAKQEDLSTPLHFACAQGSRDMVETMHDMQPERFRNALESQDVLKMTPLHRAALFDHVKLVEYLIALNADINAQDIHERTPLLLASSKGGWQTVHMLLQNGADIKIKDKENRNFLHLAIRYGVSIDNFGCAVIKGVKKLLNEGDDFGCTPLHYASKEGHLVAIDDLLKLGANISPKDNDRKSPFHFAARYGRFNTCKILLESVMGPNIINETDGDGLSALHIAAENGHTKIITLLMQKGAYITKDNKDNSPLHLAALNGYTRSIRHLLTVHPHLLDSANNDGDTALHIASRAGHVSAVELLMCIGAKFEYNGENMTFVDIAITERHNDTAHAIVRNERWEEALNMCSHVFSSPMNGLVQHLPDVCMAVLDRCQTTSTDDSKSKDFYIEYNFKFLQCPIMCMKASERKKEFTPMLALNTMVRHGRVQCLSHPLSEAYLNMKWSAYGSWFHVTNFIVYAIFLATLTLMVTTCKCRIERQDVSVANGNGTVVHTVLRGCEPSTMQRFSIYVVLIFCGLNVLKELLQMVQQKLKYFTDMTNLLEWVLYVTSIFYIAPFLGDRVVTWQWEAGSVAVFLAWFNCLLFLQRSGAFGIYVVMFLEILRTLLQVLCVFSILMIAFAMTFFHLLNGEENRAFFTPGQSLLRTAMMMLELDFMASFNEPYTDEDPASLYFGGMTIFFLVVFVLLMPILLMNLLIGLAVGDIVSVQKNATLKRLAMQVELHTDLERRLPWKILEMVDKQTTRYYPNRAASQLRRVWTTLSLNTDTFGADIDSCTSHQNHLYGELYKQKRRMKDMSTQMTKQYDLLRLIVQKMEIHTEEDNRDEGNSTDTMDIIKPVSKWTPMVTHNMKRQSVAVAKWKRSMDKGM